MSAPVQLPDHQGQASPAFQAMTGPLPEPFFLGKLLSGRKIVLAGHYNPDGDSIGSCLALALAFANMGKEVTISLNGVIPESLSFLIRPQKLFKEVDFWELGQFDRLVLVDCHSPFRVWPEAASPAGVLPIPHVAVDHHQTKGDPVQFEAGFVDPGAAATAELVFKVLRALEADFTPAIVEALLAGLISDTGSFSQGNSTSESLRQASELVAMGGDIERVTQALRQNWPLSRLRLLASCLGSLQLHHGGLMASMMVTEEMLKEANSDLSETEGLVEYNLLLAGVKLGALVKVTSQGRIRVSLRSRPGLDVREIAKKMGGGGHMQAAAYLDPGSDPFEALERLVSKAASLLQDDAP